MFPWCRTTSPIQKALSRAKPPIEVKSPMLSEDEQEMDVRVLQRTVFRAGTSQDMRRYEEMSVFECQSNLASKVRAKTVKAKA